MEASGIGAAASAATAPSDSLQYDYDLVVIGGGSGGLATAKEAADLGKKVALLDYVTPTPQGTSWGLGGTCVNVGCIPKKLMHQAGLLGEAMSDARSMGWKLPEDAGTGKAFSWEGLVEGVQNHVGSLNFGYRVQLRSKKVEYINAKGAFLDPHTIEATKRNGQKTTFTAARAVIAVGGRPKYLEVPGSTEHCITSDDIFSLATPPGKTLVVGASYIALETAGFLTAMGFETHVMARSIFLRGFDQEVAEYIAGYMERHGTKFLRKCTPVKFEKTADGKVACTFKNHDLGTEHTEVYDTVLQAVGREAVTRDIGLDKAGVVFNPSTGKIVAPNEQTNVPNIYAIGDVLESRQELTPVAIKAGIRLARRLFAEPGSHKARGPLTMDYNLVPTTVFTPLEYGCVGMSEELAVETYGAENVEVYHSFFKPLEWSTNHEEHDGQPVREDNACFYKIITNLKDDERVLGLHYLGPNAAEVTQGFAVAVKMGARKVDLDDTVGIHPSMAEEFTTMHITKRSGESALKSGC